MFSKHTNKIKITRQRSITKLFRNGKDVKSELLSKSLKTFENIFKHPKAPVP